jgi:hypothetical protein
MKTRLTVACVFVLGATLVLGCGGIAPEDAKDTQTPPATEGDNSPEEQVASEEDRPVGDFAACCYVSCRDGAGDRWRGPFPKVKYGNCKEYGLYYCGQHKKPYKAAKWDEC